MNGLSPANKSHKRFAEAGLFETVLIQNRSKEGGGELLSLSLHCPFASVRPRRNEAEARGGLLAHFKTQFKTFFVVSHFWIKGCVNRTPGQSIYPEVCTYEYKCEIHITWNEQLEQWHLHEGCRKSGNSLSSVGILVANKTSYSAASRRPSFRGGAD